MTTQPRKPDLFDFNDFRAYLADWYDYQCTTPAALTKAEICRQLGLPNSRSYFGDVLSGKYVSPPKVKLFVKLLAFDDDQSRFFKTLVDYNHNLPSAGLGIC